MKQALAALPAFFLIACAGHQQSAVDSAGPQAGRIANLWWFFFWVLLVVFAIVLVTLLVSLSRGHRGIEQEPLEQTHEPSEATERRLNRAVGAATAITIVILFVLL